MKPEVRAMWEKLEGFQLDQSGTVLDFTARLARENGWTRAYAQRVVVEYKRFLLLAMRAGHPVTPSEEVDQAWHLHMVYTRSYWQRLCGEVLGRPLHHEPTAGGAAEGLKFRQQYQRTLESYREMFGDAAPEDIWPPVEKRFQPQRMQWVDVGAHWVLPRPRWVDRITARAARVAFAALGTALLLAGCRNVFEVFNFKGPEFLLFYTVGFGVALVASWVLVALARSGGGRVVEPPADPYEAAFLGGGGARAVDAALASLATRGLLKLDTTGSGDAKVATTAGADLRGLSEFEQKLLAAAPANLATPLPAFRRSLRPMLDALQERLATQGFLWTAGAYRRLRWLAALPFLVLMIAGFIKLGVGLDRDKPVGFLMIFLAVTLMVMIARINRVRRRTPAGDAAWAGLGARAEHLRADVRAQCSRQRGSPLAADPLQVAMLVAVAGYMALPPESFGAYRAALHRPGGDSSGGGCGTSSGCSSSSGGDGGGDGGSGCGGSGCGGCGGGGD